MLLGVDGSRRHACSSQRASDAGRAHEEGSICPCPRAPLEQTWRVRQYGASAGKGAGQSHRPAVALFELISNESAETNL